LPILTLIMTTVVACSPAPKPSTPAGPDTGNRPALFYAKDGSLYVSDPAGAPGRKLTDGPADTDPAPSPDGSRVAFVRKGSRADGGGELWVMDVSDDSAPAGTPRRLVDPKELLPNFEGDDPARSTVRAPRWSPAGDRIAFLKAGGNGGFLLTASADTGKVEVPPRPLYADEHYAWAPDGKRIAWVTGRMDVSPVNVSVLTVGEGSQPIVTGTNADSVDYADGGRSLVFVNSDANGSSYRATPFTLRDGGVYTVEPPAAPRAVFTGSGAYADVAALWKGAVGFTQWSADQKTKSIQVVRPGSAPRTIADTRSDAPGPRWVGETVAYVGTADDRPLLITTDGAESGAAREPQRIDAGVEAFAWGD
jgi:dipeptidyl aminopeptidase/acylaminoacyl peptidase